MLQHGTLTSLLTPIHPIHTAAGCDDNDDCKGDLKCYGRNYGVFNTVPGCEWASARTSDVKLKNLLQNGPS